MTILHTKEANIISFHFGGEVEETVEYQEGLFLDLDKSGRVIGVESHDAADFLEQAASADGVELPESFQSTETLSDVA